MAEQEPLPPMKQTEAWRKLVAESCGPDDEETTSQGREEEDENG